MSEETIQGQPVEVESADELPFDSWWRVKGGEFDRIMLNSDRAGIIGTYGELYTMNGCVLNVVKIRDFRYPAGSNGTKICFKLFIEDSQGLRPGNYFIPRGTVTLVPYEGEVPEN